jgi:hypothetical protein
MIGGNGLHSAERQSTSRTQHFVFLPLQEEMLASSLMQGRADEYTNTCTQYIKRSPRLKISPLPQFTSRQAVTSRRIEGVPTMSDPSTEATASVSAPQPTALLPQNQPYFSSMDYG